MAYESDNPKKLLREAEHSANASGFFSTLFSSKRSRYERAADLFSQAAGVFRAKGMNQEAAAALEKSAAVYSDKLSEFRESEDSEIYLSLAIDKLLTALDVYVPRPPKGGGGAAQLGNDAKAVADLAAVDPGELVRILNRVEMLFPEAERLESRRDVKYNSPFTRKIGTAFSTLASVYQARGDDQSAVEAFKKSGAWFVKGNWQSHANNKYRDAADLAATAGNFKTASELYYELSQSQQQLFFTREYVLKAGVAYSAALAQWIYDSVMQPKESGRVDSKERLETETRIKNCTTHPAFILTTSAGPSSLPEATLLQNLHTAVRVADPDAVAAAVRNYRAGSANWVLPVGLRMANVLAAVPAEVRDKVVDEGARNYFVTYGGEGGGGGGIPGLARAGAGPAAATVEDGEEEDFS